MAENISDKKIFMTNELLMMVNDREILMIRMIKMLMINNVNDGKCK